MSGCLLGQDSLPPGMQSVIRDLDQTASEAIKNPNDVGYTLGVVTRSGLAWSKNYGAANAETAYGIGAAPFTAIMLLQLVQDGNVHLSDRVEKYVPELQSVHSQYPDASPVTLLQLALHTSGLTLDSKEIYSRSAAAEWEKGLLAATPRISFEFEPGTHATLSNVDDAILALALARAAHQPYTEYLRQRILLPLGMSHTESASLGYRPVLFSTLGDLARFAAFEMLGGPDSVLSRMDLEENYRRIWVVNSVAVPNPSEGYGIGYEGETWTSNHYYFIPPIGYGGHGYEAALWFEPRRHAGVILLHQGPGGSAFGQMIHSYVYTLNAQKNDAGKQEPARPFPYTEEEVTFANASAGIKLAGTLTLPEGKGPFPAVILIPKSGPLDRDERLLNHRTFFVLADYLTRAGIAVLRTDVRGVGKSGGKFPGQADDFVGDAEAALDYLKSRPEVNGRKIGILSHGEGGLIAPRVASLHPEVSFVVMLGAPAVPSAENSVEGTRLTLEGNGELPRKAEAQAADTRRVYALLRGEKDPAELEKQLREYLAGRLPEAQIAGQIRQWTSPAFLRQITNDPAVELKKLACPVLALYAEKDFSAPASLNLPAMRAALADSGSKQFEVEQLPDLNMLFQTADVGIGREANWAEETISPVVMKRIADWVAAR